MNFNEFEKEQCEICLKMFPFPLLMPISKTNSTVACGYCALKFIDDRHNALWNLKKSDEI